MEQLKQVNQEVEEFAKSYLHKHHIETEPRGEKDRWNLSIHEKDGLFYIENKVHFFDKTVYPGDKGYHPIAGGLPMDRYTGGIYAFVCDQDKNILVDIERINCAAPKSLILDKNNFLFPKRDEENALSNSFVHYRIEEGDVRQIHFFGSSWCKKFIIDDALLNNNLIVWDGQFYNFKEGLFLKDKYNEIIFDTSYSELSELALKWGLLDYDETQFIENIKNKMQQEDLIGGYKELIAKQKIEDSFNDSKTIAFCYDTFVFLNKNGTVASDVYYLDGLEFKSIPFVNEKGETAYNILQSELDEKLRAKLAENQEKEKMYSKIMDKMLPQKKDKN